MNKYPLISVIIPTYNYAHFINEAIESILNQNYPQEKIEIIVVDDGSTDKTRDVLDDYINKGLVTYFFQENNGKANATRNAINQTKGKYIFNLDADDLFLKNKIATTVEVFESKPAVIHVASPAEIYDSDNKKIKGIEQIPKEIINKELDGYSLLKFFYTYNIFFGGGSTYAAKASVLRNISIPSSADMYIDEFLFLAVAPFGKSFFINKPLSVWRVHQSNYSVGKLNASKQKEKANRLLQSSNAILTYIHANNFDEHFIKIYKLKHNTRLIAAKENEHTKNLKDIFLYAKEVFFKIKPEWRLIKSYQVLNRLLPLPLFSFLKKINFLLKAKHKL